MNEKLKNRLLIASVILNLGLGVWLGLVYRNGGDTKESLAAASAELTVAIAGNARIEKELIGLRDSYSKLRDQQLESSAYQRELEAELEFRNDIIRELKSASGNLAESSQRVDDLAREYAKLIREGNEFIEDGEK